MEHLPLNVALNAAINLIAFCFGADSTWYIPYISDITRRQDRSKNGVQHYASVMV